MKLIVDINIPYLKGVLEPYFEEVLYLPGKQITHEDVKDADALLVRTRTNCNETLLEGSTVKFIGSATIGSIISKPDTARRRALHGQMLLDVILGVFCSG